MDTEAVIGSLSWYERERGKPLPDTIHAAIQMNLGAELLVRYRQSYRILSELSLATLPEGTTPDVAVYPAFALDYEHRTARRTDAPLLCIEIQSPSQSAEEMVNKTNVYFAFGVRSCWVVVPAVKGIFVYDRPGHYAFFHGDDTLHDPTLDITLPLSAVFE
jgi:Uma2 family endonuclease